VWPTVARTTLWQAARELDSTGLLLLLTKYYLTPEQVVGVQLVEDQVLFSESAELLRVTGDDFEVIVHWLRKSRRPRTARGIRDYLRRVLQPRVHDLLAELDMSWRCYLTIGIRDLRRYARECLASAAILDEGTYREMLHDEAADSDDTLRFLTIRSRSIINGAVDAEVTRIRELLDDQCHII
jgi:hypothetical protein